MGHEGGYANNPKDRGGETYKGVSRVHWPNWAAWRLIDSITDSLTPQPPYGSTEYKSWVKHLDGLLEASVSIQNKVQEFYRENFWRRLGEVNDQRVAEEVFDKSINCGAIAFRWIQRAAGVGADGVIGSLTISTINAADPVQLLNDFNDCAKRYYNGIIDHDPSQAVFKKGWMARLKNHDETPYVA